MKETRKLPSRKRGSIRWWAEQIYREVVAGTLFEDRIALEPEDKEATLQVLEGLVEKIMRGR